MLWFRVTRRIICTLVLANGFSTVLLAVPVLGIFANVLTLLGDGLTVAGTSSRPFKWTRTCTLRTCRGGAACRKLSVHILLICTLCTVLCTDDSLMPVFQCDFHNNGHGPGDMNFPRRGGGNLLNETTRFKYDICRENELQP